MKELLIGIVAGIITGTGMGGGTVLIILLTLLLGIEQTKAQLINLIFFIPTSIAAIIINLKEKRIDKNIAKYVVTLGIIGALIGAYIANKIEVKLLKKMFGIFLFLMAIYEIFRLIKNLNKNKNK